MLAIQSYDTKTQSRDLGSTFCRVRHIELFIGVSVGLRVHDLVGVGRMI